MMRVAVAVVALAFLFTAVAATATALPLDVPRVERLQIHNDHIVWFRVGVPGKWCRFRVRFDTSEMYLFQHPSPYSRSWIPLPQTSTYGQPTIQEIIRIGTTRVRMPVIVGEFYKESAASAEGTQAEGILGIGAQSPLWTLWRNFTKTRDYIHLGHVLDRVVDNSHNPNAIHAAMADPVMYGVDAVKLASFVMRMSAHLSADSVTSVQHGCKQALLSSDQSSDLASSQQLLVQLLAVQKDEKSCMLDGRNYTVILAPEADYNIIPPMLTLHPPSHPPMFVLSEYGPTADSKARIHAVLFDMYEDMYIEMDPTNNAGTGVNRMANRAGYDDNTIVLGSFGLRRLELAFKLDDLRADVTIRHGGLSQTGQLQRISHSPEVRHVRDISIIVAGVLLWALWAAEPDPVFPRHTSMQPEKYAHSAQRTLTTAATAPPPPPQKQLPQAQITATPDDDNEIVLPNKIAIPSPPPPQKHAKSSVSPSGRKSLSLRPPTREQQLRALSQETAIRVWAVLEATSMMEIEWPVSANTLLYANALSEALVFLYFVMALGFYDTTWALTIVIKENATNNSIGWTVLAFVWLAVLALSALAFLSVGRDARLGSLCMQAQLLAAISVLMISLFQWDLALSLLFFISGILTVVIIMMVGHVSGFMPQYYRRAHNSVFGIRPVVILLGVAYLLFMTLALFPFLINRLWDTTSMASVIAVFIVLSVSFPIASYLVFLSFMYPIALANAACKCIIDSARQRVQAITGSPI